MKSFIALVTTCFVLSFSSAYADDANVYSADLNSTDVVLTNDKASDSAVLSEDSFKGLSDSEFVSQEVAFLDDLADWIIDHCSNCGGWLS